METERVAAVLVLKALPLDDHTGVRVRRRVQHAHLRDRPIILPWPSGRRLRLVGIATARDVVRAQIDAVVVVVVVVSCGSAYIDCSVVSARARRISHAAARRDARCALVARRRWRIAPARRLFVVLALEREFPAGHLLLALALCGEHSARRPLAALRCKRSRAA